MLPPVGTMIASGGGWRTTGVPEAEMVLRMIDKGFAPQE